MMRKLQLLCSFSTRHDYHKSCSKIQSLYFIPEKRIFVFLNGNDGETVYLTYNVIPTPDKNLIRVPNTISIHRKKETNTMYTLNAMNVLIKEENDGIFDDTFIIQWDLYKNSIVLSSDVSVKITPIDLIDVVKI